MPNATVYIKEDDWEQWQNIPNKSKWVHEGLTTGFVMIPAKSTPKKEKRTTSLDMDEIIKKGSKHNLCKNGHPALDGRPGRCIVKSCKYNVYA